MIALCTKCRQLYEALETEPLPPEHLCPRCAAVAELLAATAELIAEVQRQVMPRAPVVLKTNLRPAIERSTRAVEKASTT